MVTKGMVAKGRPFEDFLKVRPKSSEVHRLNTPFFK